MEGMAEEDPSAEIDALLVKQARRSTTPAMIRIRDLRSLVQVNKPREEDTIRATLCVDAIEELPKLWRFTFVDVTLLDRRAVLKTKMKMMDRTSRNSVIFQVTMWKPRKRPLGGVNCPYQIGDVVTVEKVHKLRFYFSLLQGEVEAEDWMVA
ncbi:hypothetical protein PI124_g12883 [Phytophthora idaei]|nr:hypothetical protein PI125_g12388 [Phytophthora idaei]KAG3150489.1 hypothetical protein PI126_g11478 [Phytophthora idaei]KAG3242272.1 hypothetical protein PI124_g12883 [Phytophthora idaei]